MNNEDINFTDAEMLRNLAEEKLKVTGVKKIISAAEADLQKLVHELQVHQIELEMQNDELRYAYETAEKALKNYTMLFDLSPMGYITLNSEAAICDLNFTAAEILGERRFSLIDSNFKLYISDESKAVFNNFFKKVYTTYAKESCEVVLGYNKKLLGTVYIEGIIADNDQKCLLSIVDVSKFNMQKKA